MTSIERNFNGTVYRVSVKEEERGMRMIEEEEGAISKKKEGGVKLKAEMTLMNGCTVI